jgi:hypothetical protein
MKTRRKRAVAALLAATTLVSPLRVWAEDYEYFMEEDSSGLCSRYAQVKSNATGGDYVGGTLKYETLMTTTTKDPSTTVTTSTTTGIQIGIPGDNLTTTTTVTVTTVTDGATKSYSHPVGYYTMNDGSTYLIDCITGDAKKL